MRDHAPRRALLAAASLALAAAAVPAVAAAQPTLVVPASGPPAPNPTRVGLMFRPNHVCLRVRDLDASVRWWADVFGARPVRRSRVEAINPGAEIAFLHLADGFHVELVGGGQVRQAVPPPATIAADYGVEGYKHFGLLVDDMDRVLAHFARHGVGAEYDTTRPDYGQRIVLVKEPNGYFIELYAPLA